MTKHTILFLAANPLGTDRLALDEEARAIQGELERSGHRDQFELVTRWAVRPLDLLRALRKLKPTIVHFSGQGSGCGHAEPRSDAVPRPNVVDEAVAVHNEPQQRGLFFQGNDGRPHLVSTAALKETFGATASLVRLVVLNAGNSEMLAEALLEYVDCVVEMGGSSRQHEVATSFAIGFYGALGEGESVAAAYKQGCAAISLEGLSDSDQPQLMVRDGADADRLVLSDTSREAVRGRLARAYAPKTGGVRQIGHSADPDRDIVGFVARDDTTGALRCLMQRHGTAVYLYCREALLDPALAANVQQQVFIEAFRDLPRFAHRSSLRTWLFAIARHRVLDAAKAAHRRVRFRVDDRDASDGPKPRLSPGQRLDDARLPEALIEGLDNLSTPGRTAVLLRFQHGFTFEDIATICDEKPETVQARVARAMVTLRTCVEREIENALARLGAGHAPPPGWEARVLAATRITQRRPRWVFGVPVLAAVA